MLGILKKKKPKPGGGGDVWGSDTYDGSGGGPGNNAPPASSSDEAPPSASGKISLLEALDPIFLHICEEHRIAREGGEQNFGRVRSEIKRLLDELDEKASRDPVIRQHMEKLDNPLRWYIDFTFAAPESRFSFRDEWHDQRLGFYGDDGNLAGDEAFFDELDTALKTDSKDTSANERLAFYYVCLGLGFTGFYFNDLDTIKKYQQRIYPRISHLVDLHSEGRITPDAYKHTDKRDFIAVVRDRPLIMIAVLVLSLFTILAGYLLFYDHQVNSLKVVMERLTEETDE